MTQTLTAKIHILPSEEEKKQLSETMKAYSDACNFVSAHIFYSHELKYYFLNKALYHDLRERFGLKSQMAQSVIKTVIARYLAIGETRKEWIKPCFKKPQLDLVWNRDYSLTKGLFSVNTLCGRTAED